MYAPERVEFHKNSIDLKSAYHLEIETIFFKQPTIVQENSKP